MNHFFFWLAISTALANWISIHLRRRWLDYATKPGVMAALLLWWLSGLAGWDLSGLLIALAIGFSLMGDVALMLPRERFILGLVFFLIALLLYSIAILQNPPPFNASTVLLAGFVLLPLVRLYPIVLGSLESSGMSQLKIPVTLYAAALTLFLYATLGTLANEGWMPIPAVLAAAGGLLFYLSDNILAWNRFVRPIHKPGLKNRVPYHLGQIALIAGLLQGLGG